MLVFNETKIIKHAKKTKRMFSFLFMFIFAHSLLNPTLGLCETRDEVSDKINELRIFCRNITPSTLDRIDCWNNIYGVLSQAHRWQIEFKPSKKDTASITDQLTHALSEVSEYNNIRTVVSFKKSIDKLILSLNQYLEINKKHIFLVSRNEFETYYAPATLAKFRASVAVVTPKSAAPVQNALPITMSGASVKPNAMKTPAERDALGLLSFDQTQGHAGVDLKTFSRPLISNQRLKVTQVLKGSDDGVSDPPSPKSPSVPPAQASVRTLHNVSPEVAKQHPQSSPLLLPPLSAGRASAQPGVVEIDSVPAKPISSPGHADPVGHAKKASDLDSLSRDQSENHSLASPSASNRVKLERKSQDAQTQPSAPPALEVSGEVPARASSKPSHRLYPEDGSQHPQSSPLLLPPLSAGSASPQPGVVEINSVPAKPISSPGHADPVGHAKKASDLDSLSRDQSENHSLTSPSASSRVKLERKSQDAQTQPSVPPAPKSPSAPPARASSKPSHRLYPEDGSQHPQSSPLVLPPLLPMGASPQPGVVEIDSVPVRTSEPAVPSVEPAVPSVEPAVRSSPRTTSGVCSVRKSFDSDLIAKSESQFQDINRFLSKPKTKRSFSETSRKSSSSPWEFASPVRARPFYPFNPRFGFNFIYPSPVYFFWSYPIFQFYYPTPWVLTYPMSYSPGFNFGSYAQFF